MKFQLYKGNPRLDKRAKKLFIVEGITKAFVEVMRLRIRHNSDIYYIREIADIA